MGFIFKIKRKKATRKLFKQAKTWRKVKTKTTARAKRMGLPF
jgi:hypothetical protein